MEHVRRHILEFEKYESKVKPFKIREILEMTDWFAL